MDFMSWKNFQFTVTNMRTNETCGFIGSGETIKDALADAIKNANDSFRPKNDGKMRPPNGVMIRIGEQCVHRTLQEFESDFPYTEKKSEEQAVAVSEDLDFE